MAFDMKRYIDSGLYPLIALTAVAIIYNLKPWTPPYNSLLSILQLCIVGWAGFRATNKNGIGLFGSAAIGFLTGAIANFVEVIVIACINISRNGAGVGPLGPFFVIFIILGTILLGTIEIGALWIAFGIVGGSVGIMTKGPKRANSTPKGQTAKS